MQTNFTMLKSLIKDFKPKSKGFLSQEEVMKIESELHLQEMDILALRNLRDFTVLYLSSKDKEDSSDLISGITAVIDHVIFAKGGEV